METVQVAIRILDKEYTIACPREERDGLLRSAHMLDQKMREIRSGGKVIGAERIAVMAALNIAHELVQYESRGDDRDRDLEMRLAALQEKIDAVLGDEDPQLEL